MRLLIEVERTNEMDGRSSTSVPKLSKGRAVQFVDSFYVCAKPTRPLTHSPVDFGYAMARQPISCLTHGNV